MFSKSDINDNNGNNRVLNKSSGWQNSLVISYELTAYFSLEITP